MFAYDSAIISHRGASAYAPENTMAAFNKALALGSRFVEFDVKLSADGEAFIFHDDILDRTTNGRGLFAKTSQEVIKTLDAGRWFSRRFRNEPIPLLSDVLTWLVKNRVYANIEIKPSVEDIEATTVAILTAIRHHWPASATQPLLSSFEISALQLCRSIDPDIPLGLLMHIWQKDWLLLARELNCFSIHLNRWLLTPKRAMEIKDNGYKLYVYTVNRQRQARKFISWGVDAVFSDYPDLL